MGYFRVFQHLNRKITPKYLLGKNTIALNLTKNNLNHSHYVGSFLKHQHNPQTFKLTTLTPTFFRQYSDTSDLICYSELKKLRKTTQIVIVDVRSHEETSRTGTIPGALCIPYGEIETALCMEPDDFQEVYCREKPDQETQVVVICRKGNRSYKAVRIFRELGYENCQSLQGGFVGWFEQERIRREKRSASKQKSDDC